MATKVEPLFSDAEARGARAMGELLSLGLELRGHKALANEMRKLTIMFTGLREPYGRKPAAKAKRAVKQRRP